jgi:hypothetical protein
VGGQVFDDADVVDSAGVGALAPGGELVEVAELAVV